MRNPIRTFSLPFAAFALLLSSAACRTVNTTEPAAPSAARQMLSDKRITTDSSLDFNARITAVNQAVVGSGDLLKVQAELCNNGRGRKHFSYKFEWFDQNAMLIQAPAPVWIPRAIEGRETINISAVAPNPQARDFRLKLIEK